MPWCVRGKVELRLEFVRRVVEQREPFAQVCREYGVSRPTGYLWLRRYQETGRIQSLVDRSRRPETSPNQTDSRVEERVVALREKYG
jgi:transposase-like protein